MLSRPMRRFAAVAVAGAALFAASAGNAAACDGHHGTRTALAATFGHHHRHGLLRAASTYLGIAPEQLVAQLKSGKTLAQVADATPGKSSTGLVNALVAAVKTKLDAWVAAGKLTAAKESEILARLTPKITALVNMSWQRHH